MQKVHAIVGGFHLGPAPADYLKQVIVEIKKLEPDVVIPIGRGGCSVTSKFLLERQHEQNSVQSRFNHRHSCLKTTLQCRPPKKPHYIAAQKRC